MVHSPLPSHAATSMKAKNLPSVQAMLVHRQCWLHQLPHSPSPSPSLIHTHTGRRGSAATGQRGSAGPSANTSHRGVRLSRCWLLLAALTPAHRGWVLCAVLCVVMQKSGSGFALHPYRQTTWTGLWSLRILLRRKPSRYRVEACLRVDVYAEKYACFFSSSTLNWMQ